LKRLILFYAQTALLKTHYIGVKPYGEVAINGVKGFKFLIDTGASFSILMDTTKVKQLKLKEGYQLQLHGWGDEEHSPAYQTEADTLSLDSVDFSDVTFAYLPLSSSKYYLHADELIFDGVLGHDVLHHFSWKFDKKNNQISIIKKPYQVTGNEISLHIIPYEGLSYESLYNLLGLELSKLNNANFIVRYIFPQMVASNFDFKKGGIINQIDGKSSKDISLEQWLNISNHVGSHEICRIRKAKACFSMESKHIQGTSITD